MSPGRTDVSASRPARPRQAVARPVLSRTLYVRVLGSTGTWWELGAVSYMGRAGMVSYMVRGSVFVCQIASYIYVYIGLDQSPAEYPWVGKTVLASVWSLGQINCQRFPIYFLLFVPFLFPRNACAFFPTCKTIRRAPGDCAQGIPPRKRRRRGHGVPRVPPSPPSDSLLTANLRTKILNLSGFGPSRILMLSVGNLSCPSGTSRQLWVNKS